MLADDRLTRNPSPQLVHLSERFEPSLGVTEVL